MQRGKTSGISLRKAAGYAYFRRVPTQIPRATHVLTSSPGTPPLKRRWQRIMIAFYAKKAIRAASLDEWQQRYAERSTGEITECFYPQKNSPYCACTPAKIQDILHALEEYPICMKECAETEVGTGIEIVRQGFPSLLNDDKDRVHDLSFAHIESEVILACIDEQGNFYVHKIEMLDGALKHGLRCTLLAEIREDTCAGGSAHRVVWCPYIPDEDDTPDDYHALLLVTTHDNIARMWSMRSVIQDLCECSTDGGVRACASSLLGRDGVLTSKEHTAPLVDAAFSPDGTALATASNDGFVMFFQKSSGSASLGILGDLRYLDFFFERVIAAQS
ncbi:Enhancer of mRNA-decapping protein 4 [Eumeta japonica]|uniref:Enhancer of mRNA-decapping protein 4 n=1 Tax=Eumeta variegata TaxID=151549 RepID=A0A4C1Z5G7_EUMVA|nr:Enhancer of mRNA-decapping protein 4 [Eumeta japonica]